MKVIQAFSRPKHILGIAVLAGCLALTGCYNVVFDEVYASIAAQKEPLEFQSEQVSIRPEVLSCAVDAGLFENPQDMGSRTVARLTEKGRALGFSDDVSIGEAGYNMPYTQIRGKFTVEFKQVTAIREVKTGVKRVEARAGVKIAQECFADVLPLMGVRNGAISETNPAAFEFDEYGKDWRIVNVMH